MAGDRGVSLTRERLIIGTNRQTTRHTVLLSGGYFAAVVVANLIALTLLHTGAGRVWWRAMRVAFHAGGGTILLGFGVGAVLLVGLAMVPATLDAGYLPSVILGAAPMYASYVVTASGPPGWPGLVVHDTLVVAPLWAALRVAPNAVIYGTIGFVLGVAIRHLHRRYRASIILPF